MSRHREARLSDFWRCNDDALRACREEGLSFSQIASRLGVTKNSAISRWTRLNRDPENLNVVEDPGPWPYERTLHGRMDALNRMMDEVNAQWR